MALDVPESHRDLLEADVGVFATLDDGRLPQLTVVWFLLEDGEVRLSFNSKRAKTHNLRARQECSLAIVDLANPYRYLELRGRARVEPDDGYAFAARIGAKYDADLRKYDPPEATRIVVTLEPEKVYAVDETGSAGRTSARGGSRRSAASRRRARPTGLEMPVGFGPERKSTSTRPTRPAPNSM